MGLASCKVRVHSMVSRRGHDGQMHERITDAAGPMWRVELGMLLVGHRGPYSQFKELGV